MTEKSTIIIKYVYNMYAGEMSWDKMRVDDAWEFLVAKTGTRERR